MLHLVITAAGPSPEETYGGLLITGAVTIIVALIGLVAARGKRHLENRRPHPPSADEPEWVKALRAEIESRRRTESKLYERIRFLERVCLVWNIDPDTGRRLPNAREAFSGRTSDGTPSSEPEPDTGEN